MMRNPVPPQAFLRRVLAVGVCLWSLAALVGGATYSGAVVAPVEAAQRAPATASPAPLRSSTREIPALRWEERSDWLNVKTDATPSAVGDGKADDTEALQKAFDRLAAATGEGRAGNKAD